MKWRSSVSRFEIQPAGLTARASTRRPAIGNERCLLLRPWPLFVVVELFLQWRVVHANEERGLLGGRVLDQRETRRRKGVAALPREGLAVDGRLAGALDHVMHRGGRAQRRL